MASVDTSASPRWRARGTVAALLRLTVHATPLVTAWVVAALVARVVAAGPGRIVWPVVAGIAAALGTRRLARRLLPLAWLLRLDTVFPDAAPSRFRVALRAQRTGALREVAANAGTDDELRLAARRIMVLAASLHAHDSRTRGHSERVRAYTRVIGQSLGLRGASLDKLAWAGLLHDVGKLVVEPDVLVKPGRLDVHERRQIEQHPVAGYRIAEPLAPWLGEWAEAILHHHERYDGSGYPFGLEGDAISMGGRIVAVADAYEAMTAKRTYNTPKSLEAARQEVAVCAGTHFDPGVVRALLAVPLPRLARVAAHGAVGSALGGLLGGFGGNAGTSAVRTGVAAAAGLAAAALAPAGPSTLPTPHAGPVAVIEAPALVEVTTAPMSPAPSAGPSEREGGAAPARVAPPAGPGPTALATPADAPTTPTAAPSPSPSTPQVPGATGGAPDIDTGTTAGTDVVAGAPAASESGEEALPVIGAPDPTDVVADPAGAVEPAIAAATAVVESGVETTSGVAEEPVAPVDEAVGVAAESAGHAGDAVGEVMEDVVEDVPDDVVEAVEEVGGVDEPIADAPSPTGQDPDGTTEEIGQIVMDGYREGDDEP